MLGYIRADKSGLRMDEYEIYRGIYCSLCNALGRHYSPFARLLLSYDFAFAAVVMLAVSPDSCTFNWKRCPFNFTKKCWCCDKRDEISLCAHIIVIISYYKLVDNLHDRGAGRKIVSALLFPAVSLMHRKAARLAPAAEEIVSEGMKMQAETEKNSEVGIDRAAHPSSHALGRLFSMNSAGDESGDMYEFGYLLGRYVYILDAADDLPEDISKGNFNPFSSEFPSVETQEEKERFADRVRKALDLTQGALLESKDKVKFNRFGRIIENVVFSGIEESSKRILAKYSNSDEDKKSFTVE